MILNFISHFRNFFSGSIGVIYGIFYLWHHVIYSKCFGFSTFCILDFGIGITQPIVFSVSGNSLLIHYVNFNKTLEKHLNKQKLSSLKILANLVVINYPSPFFVPTSLSFLLPSFLPSLFSSF